MTATKPVLGSFADVPLQGGTGPTPTPGAVTEQVGVAAAAHGYTAEQLVWSTPEGIDVKPVFIGADRDDAVAAGYPLDSFPGDPPFIRGPYPTMLCEPAVDHPAVRGVLHRCGIERVLSA